MPTHSKSNYLVNNARSLGSVFVFIVSIVFSLVVLGSFCRLKKKGRKDLPFLIEFVRAKQHLNLCLRRIIYDRVHRSGSMPQEKVLRSLLSSDFRQNRVCSHNALRERSGRGKRVICSLKKTGLA